MASKTPAVKNAAYIFRCVLFAQSDNQIKSNPTIASGDWKVSIDGGAFANLATLPDVDPDSSVQVKVSLSADEMNGDEIMVTAIDASGAEWHSAAWVIHTAAQTFDTMDTNIDSILTDTNELQGDWANGGRLDVILDARASQSSVDDVPTNAEFNARTLAAADYFDPATDTVANVTTVGTVTNPVTAGTVSDKTGYSLSAAGIQAIWDALTSGLTTIGSIGKLLVDRIDAAITSRMATFSYAAPPTAGAIADQVWDEALSGHLTAGSTGEALDDAGGGGGASAADVWAYGTRTLTTAAVVGPGAEIDGDDITAWRGDSFSVSFSDLGNVTARTALWFTAKRRSSQADDDAMIQVTEDDDLLYINGAAAETAANGTLTVTDAAAGDMTLALAAEETAKMPAGAVLVWDIQMLTASGVSTLAAGTITFTADVTRATS